MSVKSRIVRVFACAVLTVGMLGIAAPVASASGTFCGHNVQATVVWSGGTAGVTHGGKIGVTAYGCWNGGDSWTNAPIEAWAFLGGYRVALDSQTQWASGSDTYYQWQFHNAIDTYCTIFTFARIKLTKDGQFSITVWGDNNHTSGCFLGSALGNNDYYGLTNYPYIQ